MAHPLEKFRYCPCCGSSQFVVNDGRSKCCKVCGFTYYHNASTATVAIILNAAGELLVTRRAFEPAKGTLDLPGGFVDAGEAVEEGCLREVLEETGARAEIVRYLFSIPNTYCYSGFEVHTSDCFFICSLLPGETVHAEDDAAELMWLPLGQLSLSEFGLASIRQGLERLLPLLKNKNVI